jgi:hypothetical protein
VISAVGPVLVAVDFSVVLPDVLLPIDAIDTFAKAATIDAARAAPIAQPLALPEADVKRHIAKIIGEPYLDQDWGGELSDLLTARVELRGRRVTAAFLLKGSGTKGELTPKRLGKNADQIRRLGKQHADLYVVQHVDKVAEATRDQLRDMVSAIRFREGREAVGSVWDGVDCARLFLAHGLIVESD